jgi:hypothetical protein
LAKWGLAGLAVDECRQSDYHAEEIGTPFIDLHYKFVLGGALTKSGKKRRINSR